MLKKLRIGITISATILQNKAAIVIKPNIAPQSPYGDVGSLFIYHSSPNHYKVCMSTIL